MHALRLGPSRAGSGSWGRERAEPGRGRAAGTVPGGRRARAALLAVWAACLLAACGGSDQGAVVGEEYLDMRADRIMTGVEYHLTGDGIRRARLLADTAYTYEDSAHAEFRGVHLTLFEESGAVAAVLTAAKGDVNTRTNDMTARGNVVLVTHDGNRRVETEVLHYSPGRNRIWSDTTTTLTENGRTLRGSGFTADGQLRNIELREPRGQAPGVKVEF
ncbi:MAG TPA: LPS export ABC transporter periplasmic protein LptC [Longimicrobiales bacterium]